MSKKIELFFFVAITILLFSIFSWNINQHFGIVVIGDELGYLAHAAHWYGFDFSGVMHTAGYWSYGYSLILFPLFLLFNDPILILRTAVILNCIILSLVFPLVYSFGKNRIPNASKSLLITISISTSLFHANIVMARIIWPEALLIFIFWLLCCILQKINKSSHIAKFILLGFLLGYVYVVHSRAFTITISGIIVLILMKIFSKITFKQLFIVVGIVIPIYLLDSYVADIMKEAIWLRTTGLGTDFSGMMNALLRSLTNDGFLLILRSFIGHLISFGASTYLMGFIGVILLFKNVILNFNDIYINKNSSEYKITNTDVFVDLFILIPFLLTIGLSILILNPPERLEWIIHERYLYSLTGPILFIALINLFFQQKKHIDIFSTKKFVTIIVSFFIMCLILALSIRDFDQTSFSSINQVGVGGYFRNGELSIVLLFTVTILVSIILFITSKMQKKYHLLTVALLTIFFIVRGTVVVSNEILVGSQFTYQRYNIIAQTIRDYSNGLPVFHMPDVHWSSFYIQFFMMDVPMTLTDSIPVAKNDHLLLTMQVEPDLLSYYEIYSSVSNITILRPLRR